MIQSMTGFGHGEVSNKTCKIELEMKSVNHRYLDVNIRLPRKLNFLESDIRNQVKQYASRGKVDLYLAFSDLSGERKLIWQGSGSFPKTSGWKTERLPMIFRIFPMFLPWRKRK